jgi:hypothetical protein
MSFIQEDLIYLEQFVNDRRRSSHPPDISPDLIPETSSGFPMLWAVLPEHEVKIFSGRANGELPSYSHSLFDEKRREVYFPIHPLQVDAYKKNTIINSGKAYISASYRTIFYQPDKDSKKLLLQPPGCRIMLKLHLDNPLPGIQGERRLSPEIVLKCLSLSRELSFLEKSRKLDSYLRIISEEVGLIHKNRGALVRILPNLPLVPAFSLSSLDLKNPNKEILAATILRKAKETTGTDLIQLFGSIFIEPLVFSLLSAFRQGFSLEMHMQNVLMHFSEQGLVENVYYSNLEGVIFSRQFRCKHGLTELFRNDNNPELFRNSNKFRRYFNRNIDHDLGRIFENLLIALNRSNVFRTKEIPVIVKSVRKTIHKAMQKYDFKKWAFLNHWLRISRTPYGNGIHPSHYYFCKFR